MNTTTQMHIVIVGHVDHGKSSLVGRLLADAGCLPSGKLEKVEEYCRRNARIFEYAYLVDVLKNEQAQGITIDSARCFFQSKERSYILIDAPGHIEFLKNMVSGAARAEAAIIVIDAHEGIQENSRRHGYMLRMLGITQVLVAVNKMDLCGYEQKVFEQIQAEFALFLAGIGVFPQTCMPVSARWGDNLVGPSPHMPWYHGLSLLEAIDRFHKEDELERKPFRMPVQDVYKFTGNGDERRIVAGRILSGRVAVGDRVLFLPSHKCSQIRTSETFPVSTRQQERAGSSCGFTLSEQVYVSRGEFLCKSGETEPFIGTTFQAHLFWLGQKPLVTDKAYKLKLATAEVMAQVESIAVVIDSSSLVRLEKQQVARNEVAECIIKCRVPIAFDLYATVPATGRFVLVDEYDIAGGGIITKAVYDLDGKPSPTKADSSCVSWQAGYLTRKDRLRELGYASKVLWFTGLSGAGKSTLASAVEKRLVALGRLCYVLDGDNVRHGLNSDLGFSPPDREENIRRLGEVAWLFYDAGLFVLVCAISPYRQDRERARNRIGEDFVEIFVDCSLAECERRDGKGLYKKARAGEISNFTGIHSPYEQPEHPEVYVNTETMGLEACVSKIMDFVEI